MGKVVTGQGLQEFIESGKVTHVTDHKPKGNGSMALEVKKEQPVVDLGEKSKTTDTTVATQVEKPEDDGVDAEDQKDLADIPDYATKIRDKIGKKHRAMKEAQEAAAEAERFAEQQFNERKLAEKRAEAAELRAKELEGKASPAAKEPDTKAPDMKDFTNAQGQVDWDKYTDAKSEYAAKKAVAEDRAQRAKAESDARMQAKIQVAASKYPDFWDVLKSNDALVPDAVLHYITESDHGADLTYHLAKHPEITEKLSKMPPIKAIAEVGKLETQFEKTAKPAETTAAVSKASERGGAPPPITPISATGAGTVNTDPSKMGYRELRAYERQRAMEKKRR